MIRKSFWSLSAILLLGPGVLALLLASVVIARAEPFRLKIAAVGSPPSMHNLFMQVAVEEGFFKKNGIEVQDFMEIRAGTLATQALSSGKIDVTETDVEGVLNAASAGGFGGVAVSAPAQHLSYVVAVAKEIQSFKDLVGKPIAISRPGAISQVLMFPFLDREKIDRKSIVWVSIGGASERRLSLLGGRVKAALLHLDFALQAERDGQVHRLDTVANANPDYPHELLVVRKELAEQHPEVVTAIVRSVIEACRFIATHRERTIEIYEKHTGDKDPALAGTAYDALIAIKAYGVNGGMTRKGLDAALKLAVENGSISEPLPIKNWADFRFQDEAVKQLGQLPE
jgi:ABC-type nitrate/sulfonate/bicarbonate transport system substrate-binding protein